MGDDGEVGPDWKPNPDSPVYSRQLLERDEMRILASWLDLRGLLWFHCPNESRAPVQYRAAQAKCGVKPGVPDVLIFTPPPKCLAVGVALELKVGRGRTTPAQKAWLDALAKRGWLCSVELGASNAINWLVSLGY